MRALALAALSVALPACAPDDGATPSPTEDGGPAVDASAADAGANPDQGLDARVDAAPADQGPDAEPADQGPDAEPDAAPTPDAEPDAAPDAEPDAAPCPPGTDGPDCAEIDECALANPCGDSPVVVCLDQPAGAAPQCVCDARRDRGALVRDVPDLNFDGALPSALVVHGPGAFAVVVDGQRRPVVAAAHHGAGRVVHMAHEGVTARAPGDGTGFGELTDAALAWLGGDAPVVGVDPGFNGLANALEARGYAVRRVGPEALGDVDVYATTAYEARDPQAVAAIEAFVAAGGGLFSAGHAWWWGRDGADAPRDFPGNITLRPYGITVLADTAAGGAYPMPERVADAMDQARCGLWALGDEARGLQPLDDADRARAAQAAGGAVSALPVESPLFAAAVALSDQVGPVIPTPAEPVDPVADPLAALAVRVQVRQALDAPADQVQGHPAGDDFPGAVAPDAPRVAAAIEYDLRYAGYPDGFIYSGANAPVRLPTGQYAAPGEVITVTAPAAVVGQGVGVQIGAHSDRLWGRDAWERMPELVRRAPLDGALTRIANGFGGPVYITVPPGTDLGRATLEVAGGVPMPVYWHPGDGEAFLAEVAAADVPWVELLSGKAGMLLPTEVAAQVADPAALMAFWDQVMDVSAELAGFDPARARAERFVFDRQISAGWMHSGYPVMGHLATATEVSDLAALTTVGAWGPFHELGHNHQWGDWVLPGTTETTCNLWSVRVSEAVAGVPRADAHPAVSPAQRAQRLAAWRADPNGADWSVWVALETYLQLQEAFGWGWLPQTFQAYRALPANQRPGDDAARIQAWVVQSSLAVGHDLTDFYRAWAFPVTPQTAAAVAHLPAWADHPMR